MYFKDPFCGEKVECAGVMAPQERRRSSAVQIGRRVSIEVVRRFSAVFLITWNQLPTWQLDNEYIQSGYRPVSGSYRRSFKSLFYLHNEFINIHSHLIGAVIFSLMPIYAFCNLYQQYPTAGLMDLFVFATFFFGVSICFLLSAIFHLTHNHSARIAQIGLQLDFLGIVILMWGSTIPSIYYGFYYDPDLQYKYWANVTLLAAACATATVHPKFRQPSWRPYRAAMFGCLGLSAVSFIIHGVWKYGWALQNRRMSLDWMGVMALFNMIGAIAYAVRIPEKWYPKTFDICGCSHQILHVMVLFAALAHMFGLFRAFRFVHLNTLYI